MNDEPQKSDTPELEVKPEVTLDVEKVEPKPEKASRKRRTKPTRKSRSRDKSRERKGVGLATVFVMMFLAAIGGAVISQIYNQFGPTQKQTVTASQVQALEAKIADIPQPDVVDLGPLEARIEALEARPSAILSGEGGDEAVTGQVIPEDVESRLSALESQTPDDAGSFLVRLEDLEAKVANLKADNNTETDTGDNQVLIARLDALESAPGVTGLEERLTQLERSADEPREIAPELLERLATLETALSDMPEPVDLSSVETRIADLEQAAQALKTTQANVLKATTPIPPFPSDAVLNAIENTETRSDKGWIGKTFDKYVLADNAEAIKTVAQVESLLQQGRVDMALEQVENLPAPAQTAAQDWMDAVKARRR